MLTLTDNASTVVKAIAEQTEGVTIETGGLRISTSADQASDFAVAVASEPEADDVVVEADGARVFLEESAAEVLDDKVLDAQVDEQGAVSFAIGNAA